MQTEHHAAFLIIGNEILSGRTAEKNLPVLAALLAARGWRLAESRIIRDDPQDIASAATAMADRHSHLFTSGGIGPTHDDITTDSLAAALGLPVTEHPEALQILTAYYAGRDLPFTPARRRMARTPRGATIVKSDFPGAPAYQIRNITVCAGVPSIFACMAAAATAALPAGVIRQSHTVRVHAGESVFAPALSDIARRHPAVEIGSYPREENGVYLCQVVFTSTAATDRRAALRDFAAHLAAHHLPHDLS